MNTQSHPAICRCEVVQIDIADTWIPLEPSHFNLSDDDVVFPDVDAASGKIRHALLEPFEIALAAFAVCLVEPIRRVETTEKRVRAKLYAQLGVLIEVDESEREVGDFQEFNPFVVVALFLLTPLARRPDAQLV